MRSKAIIRYGWGVILFNLGVILWGAYVRATGSGAGCGSHWPLCDGAVLPRPERVETMIEFTHRLSSGFALVLVVGLLLWARRVYPPGHRVRTGAWLSMAFMVTEAAIGAGLVLFELVAENTSVARAIFISVHLVNTFLLLGALTLTAWWSSGKPAVRVARLTGKTWAVLIALAATLIVGVSGALTALGDTLFPVTSLADGVRLDLSPTAHFLIRLRLLHPPLAVAAGLFLVVLARAIPALPSGKLVQPAARWVIALVAVQIAGGVINVLLLAPVWMQLIHLLLADLTWIALVIFSAQTLSRMEESPAEQPETVAFPA